MNILILACWFSDKMGYAENYLPKCFGKLGHNTHLLTTDLQVYATEPNYNEVYLKHLGPRQVEQGVFSKDLFTLHRNAHANNNGLVIMGLEEKIRELKPKLVYCFEIIESDTYAVAELKKKYGFKLFCESRLHLSVYRPPVTVRQKFKQLRLKLRGRKLSKRIDIFYPIAPDVLKVITKYFGIAQKKCLLSSLAVETDLFFPDRDNEKTRKLRTDLGYRQTDIICIYTGRFTDEKGTLILAQAIDFLHKNGHIQFKGLFVGQGSKDYENQLKSHSGCQIHPFIEVNMLPLFYNAADIGVWPKQESTSQLDAAACGLPIIISDLVEDTLRVEGNGLRYVHDDYTNLADQIVSLVSCEKREELGKIGSKKIVDFYSWDSIAKGRISDYEKLMNQSL